MDAEETSSGSRGRGRGRGRGGLGKYLRARGKRGPMLRAEWGKKPTTNDEDDELDSEEERLERAKYSRRELASNADRYLEPELDPHALAQAVKDGEEVEEDPEIDLAAIRQKQLDIAAREEDAPRPSKTQLLDSDDDIDTSILAKTSRGATHSSTTIANSKKGKTVLVEWDQELDEMTRAKAAAEAQSDLKARLKKQAAAPKPPQTGKRTTAKQDLMPPLLEPETPKPDTRETMQDFLDDLLA